MRPTTANAISARSTTINATRSRAHNKSREALKRVLGPFCIEDVLGCYELKWLSIIRPIHNEELLAEVGRVGSEQRRLLLLL